MPSQCNRNDEPLGAKRDEWLSIIEQAALTKSTRGLPKPPPGLPSGGYYSFTRVVRKDGTVRIYLKWCVPGRQTYGIGSYVIDNVGHVPVGYEFNRSDDGHRVRVEVDQRGLPWPVLIMG